MLIVNSYFKTAERDTRGRMGEEARTKFGHARPCLSRFDPLIIHTQRPSNAVVPERPERAVMWDHLKIPN